MEKIQRESVYRHKSERLLDRFLVKVEKKQSEELKERLKQLQKVSQFRSGQKRQKLLEQAEKEEAKKLAAEELSARREKYKDVDHFEALCKIIKHIYEEKKFSKCLKMIIQLVEQAYDFFDGHTLFNVLDAILRYEKKFASEEDRANVEKLYMLLMEASEQEELFSQDEETLIEIYYLPVIVESSLYTDDSFKFNEGVGELMETLDSLPPYQQEHDKHKEAHLSKEFVQKHFQTQLEKKKEAEFWTDKNLYEEEAFKTQDEKEREYFFSGLKRRLFFKTLKQVIGFRKHPWAKVTISQTLKKVYLEKHKFNEEEEEELEEMISAMQSGASIMSKNEQNRDRVDQQIKKDPLQSSFAIKDARSERIIYNGENKWAQKQLGMTWSDKKS